LKNKGFPVFSGLRNRKIGYKIRHHSIRMILRRLVSTDQAMESQTVAVRARRGEDLGSMDLEAYSAHLTSDVARSGFITLEK